PPIEAPAPASTERVAAASQDTPAREDVNAPSKKILPAAAAKPSPPVSRPERPERPVETDLADPGAVPHAKDATEDPAIQQALAQAAERAKGCHVDGGRTGTARVSVTFAPSGDVTGASVGGAFANSIEAACIAARFRALHVPAFTGGDVVVR